MGCLKVDPSTFRRRVTVQTVTRTADSQGGYAEAWADAATFWADVQPVKGWERMQSMQLGSPVTHKVTMRYSPAVLTATRLLYDGRAFDVREVIDLGERKAFLELKAVEA